MTLTLIDPSSAAVVNHPSGVISVRCADYVGGARGSLSTTSDALAAAGTAVVDEQALSLPTTTAGFTASSRWSAASNSVVIPLGDLNREADTWYLPWLSLRMEGSPPSNGMMGASWLSYSVQSAPTIGVAFGIGTSMYQSIDWLPGHRVPHYTLLDFRNQFVADSETDAEDFVIRAWGVTGGDVAIYLETVYFIPTADDGFDPVYAHVQQFPTSHILQFGTNGTIEYDIDNDPSDLPDGFGKFSTLKWDGPWSPGSVSWGAIVEFQEANNERSTSDMISFGDLDDPSFYPSPLRGRLVIPVGHGYVPAVTLLTDDMSSTQNVHGTYGAHYVSKVGDYTRELGLGAHGHVQGFYDPPANTRRGTFLEGDGVATTYFGNTVGGGASGHEIPGNTALGWYGWIAYGGSENEGGSAASESTTDPRLRERMFAPHLESVILQCRCSLDTVGNGGQLVGLRYGGIGEGLAGAHIRFTEGGDVELSLDHRQNYSAGSLEFFEFAAPVAVGTYAANDWWWVKVEKRGYWWRARAWADGDTEPTTWDVEGGIQLSKYSTGVEFIDYPWDVNWAGDVTNDSFAFDPRGGTTTGVEGAHDNAHPYCMIYWESDQPRAKIFTDDFSIDWDPDGSSPDDIHMQVEKYDGSVDYGSITIPYGAHRLVETDEDVYNFDADTHGYNVRLWKEPGNPDLLTAGLGRIFMRIPLGSVFVPFIYRRVVSG